MASSGQLATRKTIENYARGAELLKRESDEILVAPKLDAEDLQALLDRLKESSKWITLSAENEPSQTAKADAGKLQITLVPRQIIRDIAEVRMYGNRKYGDPDNWKQVDIKRYRDALCRHLLAYLDDPDSVDEESGIPHYKHLACNVAFICEMEKWKNEEEI